MGPILIESLLLRGIDTRLLAADGYETEGLVDVFLKVALERACLIGDWIVGREKAGKSQAAHRREKACDPTKYPAFRELSFSKEFEEVSRILLI